MSATLSKKGKLVISLLFTILLVSSVGIVNCAEPIAPIISSPPGLFILSYYPVSIAGGATYTSSASVTISLDASKLPSSFGTPTQMSLSNSNPWTFSWENFASSKTWTLSSGDGQKTVYVAFKNSTGYVISPGVISNRICYDSITLDTLPPTLTLTTAVTNGTTIQETSYTLDWTATDAGMGLDHCEIRVDNNAWTNIGDLKSYNFPLTEGDHTLSVKAIDKSGKSQTVTVSLTVTIPPGTPTVLVEPTVKAVKKGETVTFTATPSGGSGNYTNYQWYEGTNILADKTSASVSITKNSEGTFTFYCNVTDSNGVTAKSNEATLVVTAPAATQPTIAINGNSQSTTSASVTLTVNASSVQSDATQMRFSNDNVEWSTWEAYSETKAWTLSSGNGNKDVYVQFKNGDSVESQVYKTSITLNATEEAPAEFPTLIVVAIVGVVVAIVVIIVVFKIIKKPKKLAAPAQLKITAEPQNLVADGETKSVITIQLLDKKGKPISALSDTNIRLDVPKGTVQQQVVTIPKGKDTEKTVIISSRETGPAPISANAEGLKSITITMNFTEKARYCMHCGTQMAPKARACQNCGKAPLAGVDTKTCANCEGVIPLSAKFCSECGAGQAT